MSKSRKSRNSQINNKSHFLAKLTEEISEILQTLSTNDDNGLDVKTLQSSIMGHGAYQIRISDMDNSAKICIGEKTSNISRSKFAQNLLNAFDSVFGKYAKCCLFKINSKNPLFSRISRETDIAIGYSPFYKKDGNKSVEVAIKREVFENDVEICDKIKAAFFIASRPKGVVSNPESVTIESKEDARLI